MKLASAKGGHASPLLDDEGEGEGDIEGADASAAGAEYVGMEDLADKFTKEDQREEN